MIACVVVGVIVAKAYQAGRCLEDGLVASLHRQSTQHVMLLLDTFMASTQALNAKNAALIAEGSISVRAPDGMGRHFMKDLLANDAIVSLEYADETRADIGPARNLFDTPLSIGISHASTGYKYTLYESNSSGDRLPKTLFSESNYDPRQKPWYQAAVRANTAVWTDIYLWPSGDVRMDAVVPVRKDGRFLGVLDTALTLARIRSFLNEVKPTPRSHVYIIDRDGMVVAGTDIEKPYVSKGAAIARLPADKSVGSMLVAAVAQLPEGVQSLTKLDRNKQFSYTDQTGRYVGTTLPYRDTYGLDWRIVVITPLSDMVGDRHAILSFDPSILYAGYECPFTR